VLAIGFGASQTGVAIAEDLSTGMIDRFRSLPTTSTAILAGRVAADTLRNLFVIALMTGVAAAIGFRFHAGPGPAAAAIALAAATGVMFSWVNLLLGLAVRDPESAGLAGLFPTGKPTADRAPVRSETDQIRVDFLQLVTRPSATDLRLPTAGTKWTDQQLRGRHRPRGSVHIQALT
jgi:hypothetical protein